MGLTRLAVKIAMKNPKIESYQTYLFIGPHPDDIEVGCGATVSKLAKMGKKIVFLICTDGRYGKENIKEDISADKLAMIRKEECIESGKYLGVTDIRFLDLCDGGKYDIKALKKGIADTINDVKPDIVFSPDPDIDNEFHIDHLNVGKATKEVAFLANYPEIFMDYLSDKSLISTNDVKAIAFYMTDKVNAYVKTFPYMKNQLEALYLHKSQYDPSYEATKTVALYLKLRAISFGFRNFSIYAEGFRMITRGRMHCCPEGH